MIYLAGPLFTTPEREFNAQLASRLLALGHEVFVPQENPAATPTGKAIFHKDLAGLDWADGILAIMDGADPDSGTCWECGYAYATKKPVVLFRSDLRSSGDADDIPYNAMLIGAADAHIELPLATVDEAADAIRAELLRLIPGRATTVRGSPMPTPDLRRHTPRVGDVGDGVTWERRGGQRRFPSRHVFNDWR
jgi:nucleoside 2-deoxyribosyltransferase